MRDHGGDLGAAIARFGGTPEGWIDLSTGINRVPFPLPGLPASAWRDLPGQASLEALKDTAQAGFHTRWPVLPLAGAQAAIQLLPHLAPRGQARILGPTYNEYAAALADAGWQATQVSDVAALAGADLAIVVNPNNPDGRTHSPDALRALSAKTGLLVVDESFADAHPDLSLLPGTRPENVIVLRSFGKFYGLAGVRLGFVLGDAAHLARMAARAGPWAVSGPALEIGRAALADQDWTARSIARLRQDGVRADALAARAGWRPVGGTALFRLFEVPDATAARDRLAAAHIWSRIFPYSGCWLRLGLPGTEAEWSRLAAALD
ncbi:threonine-phosphate decarboxylase CobD [Rhodovulum imhoffii]|uniref:threonine-phosphate decarboxylase CobD n=1 Tax=Rhodovulum imhoffii TaxID=365340 RepID=UPI000D35DB45|nr:threonine-phosphate decarboxylase CobD [Rhodovulum imhoffii]MBK5934191.1 threonine-phosphate decarboxylase [Rhodovulum imhoffii]